MIKDSKVERQPDAKPPSSSPCYLDDADPAYQGYLVRDAVLEILNELLEAERAGAKVARTMAKAGGGPVGDALAELAVDEAHCCAMLARHVKRLQAEPSQRTGGFKNKVLALGSADDRLRLLNRGQEWVVRKLKDALPRISDESLHHDLAEMLEVHENNIRRCDDLIHPSAGR